MPTQDKSAMHIETRVGNLETRLDTVVTTLDKMAVNFKESHDQLTENIRDISEAVSTSKATDWKTVLLGLTALGAYMTLIISPVRTTVEQNAKDLARHEVLDGHPSALVQHAVSREKIAALESASSELDSKLHIEIQGVDERSRMRGEIDKERFKSIERRLDKIEQP